jgi:hypothetical protein
MYDERILLIILYERMYERIFHVYTAFGICSEGRKSSYGNVWTAIHLCLLAGQLPDLTPNRRCQ